MTSRGRHTEDSTQARANIRGKERTQWGDEQRGRSGRNTPEEQEEERKENEAKSACRQGKSADGVGKSGGSKRGLGSWMAGSCHLPGAE